MAHKLDATSRVIQRQRKYLFVVIDLRRLSPRVACNTTRHSISLHRSGSAAKIEHSDCLAIVPNKDSAEDENSSSRKLERAQEVVCETNDKRPIVRSIGHQFPDVELTSTSSRGREECEMSSSSNLTLSPSHFTTVMG